MLLEQSIITCAVFEGNERIKVLNRKDYTEDIISNIENALLFVKQELRVEYKMTDAPRREEIYEIPLQAVREAVVNAVAHRDYFADGCHITIEVFDDRLEIGNPGGLPKGLTMKFFGRKAVRRNPIITSLLQRCGFVENMGKGINKIINLCKEQNIPEPEFISNDFFTVIFKRSKINEQINERIKNLMPIEKKLINLIDEIPGDTQPILANKLGITEQYLRKIIKGLKEKQIILRYGSNKKGYWKIIEKP